MNSSRLAHTSSFPSTDQPQPFRFKRKHHTQSQPADPRSSKRARPSASSPSRPPRLHRPRDNQSPNRDPLDQPNTEAAFRESLFDALADDEGAAFWESVYGQPIHTYSPYISTANPSDPEQIDIQRMTDDEYASYVRARMWEKSHGYIIEERRKKEDERAQRKKREDHGRDWERRVEEALKKGEERRRLQKWKEAWRSYLGSWGVLSQAENWDCPEVKEQIPWPVETGRYSDVGMEQVSRFFRNAPQPKEPGEEVDVKAVLKVERVRWHPDKFLQRAGGHGLDKNTMTKVTAVFQFIDKLWSEKRFS
ncbi:MAG: hypothetical protein Q9218_000400 [Villophora microphyllina]